MASDEVITVFETHFPWNGTPSGNSSSSKAVGWWFAVGLALVVLMSLPVSASGVCPPFVAGRSFFEELARHMPSPGQPTHAQLVELVKKGVINPLLVSPPSGPAALSVEIGWWVYPVEKPIRVEFDADGDGVPEWSESGLGPEYGQRTYTYQREGQYQFTVRIHDRGGQVTVYAAPLKVLSPSAFDADLQTRWTTMKAGLRRGDIPAALDCIHTESRSRYQKVFAALSNRLPQDVDQIFTTIRFVEHYKTEAIYEMLRIDAGMTKSFEVRFSVDADGIWRLRMF